MSNPFPHVRHSGCRSPLVLTIIIGVFVLVSMVFTIPQFFPNTDLKIQEFITLINKEYDETKIIAGQITAQDYDTLEEKITTSATNLEKPLIVNHTLIIDNFVSSSTTLTKQLALNGNDIACLLNLALQQATNTEEGETDINKTISIISFNLDTVGEITSIKAVFKVDMSSLKKEVSSAEIPSHIYLTLLGEIKNSASNYIISSKFKINDLNDEDNLNATSYLNQLFNIQDEKNASVVTIDELIRLLRTLNTTFKKNVTFSTQYIIIG